MVSGINWDDAVKGISNIRFPNTRTLDIHLRLGKLLSKKSAITFDAAFPNMRDFTTEAHWLFTEPWITKAFSGRRIERFALISYSGDEW